MQKDIMRLSYLGAELAGAQSWDGRSCATPRRAQATRLLLVQAVVRLLKRVGVRLPRDHDGAETVADVGGVLGEADASAVPGQRLQAALQRVQATVQRLLRAGVSLCKRVTRENGSRSSDSDDAASSLSSKQPHGHAAARSTPPSSEKARSTSPEALARGGAAQTRNSWTSRKVASLARAPSPCVLARPRDGQRRVLARVLAPARAPRRWRWPARGGRRTRTPCSRRRRAPCRKCPCSCGSSRRRHPPARRSRKQPFFLKRAVLEVGSELRVMDGAACRRRRTAHRSPAQHGTLQEACAPPNDAKIAQRSEDATRSPHRARCPPRKAAAGTSGGRTHAPTSQRSGECALRITRRAGAC